MNKTTSLVLALIAIAIIIGLVFYSSRDKALSPVVVDETTTEPVTSVTINTPPKQASKPEVISSSKVVVSDTTAIVTGQIVPNGAFTNYWYEYGTTTNLDKKISNQSVGSGFTAITAPGYITGLTKNTNYYYRLVAENQYGRVMGTVYSFKTSQDVAIPVGSAPKVVTTSASGVTAVTARLNGQINPNKAVTQYWFEYGQTNGLGIVTVLTMTGNGSTDMSVSAPIANLLPGTTYYFRLNAQNQFGTVNGAMMTFKTDAPAAITAPSVSTKNTTDINTSSATLHAMVNPKGADTTYWFEYSTDSNFASNTLVSTSKVSAGAGIENILVQENITGLQSKKTYYFRAVAQNTQGLTRSSTSSFRTK